MANLRAIRTRIKSIESTRQITKSMKMVAASKLRKTQQAYARLRLFAARSALILSSVNASGAGKESVLLTHPEKKGKVCYVLIVGDRGLCGTYSHDLLRYLQELRAQEEREVLLYTIGRWGKDLIGPTDGHFDVSDAPTAQEAREVTEALCDLYREGEIEEVVLIYQQFRSVLQQTPEAKVLLPLSAPEGEEDEPPPIYEPDAETVLDRLVELTLQATVHAVLLEARTGEHAARMTAMTAASDNTDELIGKLTLELNHARQAAITTEISEIVGGAAAL